MISYCDLLNKCGCKLIILIFEGEVWANKESIINYEADNKFYFLGWKYKLMINIKSIVNHIFDILSIIEREIWNNNKHEVIYYCNEDVR